MATLYSSKSKSSLKIELIRPLSVTNSNVFPLKGSVKDILDSLIQSLANSVSPIPPKL
jgi:hypothetical protein